MLKAFQKLISLLSKGKSEVSFDVKHEGEVEKHDHEGDIKIVSPDHHLLTLINSETILIVDVENLRKCVPSPKDIIPSIKRMLRSFVKITAENKDRYGKKLFVSTLVLVDNSDYNDADLSPKKLLSILIEELKNREYKLRIIHLIGNTKKPQDKAPQKIEDGLIFGIISTIYSNHKLPRKVFAIFSSDGDFARIIRYYQSQHVPIKVIPIFFIPDEKTKNEHTVVSKLIYDTSKEMDIELVRIKMSNKAIESAVV